VKKLLIVAICLVAGLGGLNAQDVHFTQQFDNSIYLNPALSGMGNKANRILLQYRDQWRTVPVPFASAFVSYDRRLFRDAGQSFGGGVQLVYDRAGDGGLSTVKASISPSYTRYFKEDRISLSVGIQAGLLHRFVNTDDLIFESQYDGTDINDNSGEALSGSVSAPDLGAGIHVGSRIGDKRHRVEGGFSVYNIHKPNLSFVENATDERPVRYNVYATSEIFIGSNGWSINPVFQYQRQENLNNILPIVYAKKYIQTDNNKDMAFSFGGGYRVDDAAQMYVAYEVGDFKLGLNYDINTSSFKDATNTVGAGEILLKYEWERKKKEEVIEVLLDSVMVDSTEIVEEIEEEEEEEVVVVVEEVIEEVEETPVVVEEKPEVVRTIIDDINGGMNINLYFPNDYPDPRSTSSTTTKSYEQIFREYRSQSVEYYRLGGQEGHMVEFMEDAVIYEWMRYGQLMRQIRALLRDGKSITVEIRGYTSPLATGDYNLNLSKRRIQSVINQFNRMEDIEDHFNAGRIKIVEMPYGETKSDSGVSDDYNNKKQSVYSDKAAYERRVEIERVIVE